MPLVLIADYCWRTTPPQSPKRFALLYPAFPLLISYLWLVLWLVAGHMNLMAIPLLWWVWKLGRELPESAHVEISIHL